MYQPDINLPKYYAYLGDASAFLLVRVGKVWFEYHHKDRKLEQSWIMHDSAPLAISELAPHKPDPRTRAYIEAHPLIAAVR